MVSKLYHFDQFNSFPVIIVIISNNWLFKHEQLNGGSIARGRHGQENAQYGAKLGQLALGVELECTGG